MRNYKFEMVFKLSDPEDHPTKYLQALTEGFGENNYGLFGESGYAHLMFNIEGNSASGIFNSTLNSVTKAIPGAELVSLSTQDVYLDASIKHFAWQRLPAMKSPDHKNGLGDNDLPMLSSVFEMYTGKIVNTSVDFLIEFDLFTQKMTFNAHLIHGRNHDMSAILIDEYGQENDIDSCLPLIEGVVWRSGENYWRFEKLFKEYQQTELALTTIPRMLNYAKQIFDELKISEAASV